MIFVAPLNGSGPLVPIGYYLNARFESSYKDRPEYRTSESFEKAPDGTRHPYAVSARMRDGRVIPVERRVAFEIPGDRFRRASILYARTPEHRDAWRRKYAAIADEVLAEFGRAVSLSKRTPLVGGGFGDAETNRKVELAAIRATKRYLRQHGYRKIQEPWKTGKPGYDLRAARPSRPMDELLVEVKGTRDDVPAFIITAREYNSRLDPRWRFAMVTAALSRPRVTLMRSSGFARAFALNPLIYRGTPRD